MLLTDHETDALGELINIAFSRSASSLSELTGQRVIIDAPRVSVHSIEKLKSALNGFVGGNAASVHQVFRGEVGGDAFLLFDYNSAVLLSQALTKEPAVKTRLDTASSEVLTEVGNIILNACLGMFSNMLELHVSFSVPRLHLDTITSLLDALIAQGSEERNAILAYASFRLEEVKETQGYLVIVLGVTSMERLVDALKKLG